jgi:hypothetical protein
MHFHAMRYWRIVGNPRPGEYLLDIGSETPDGDIANGECRVIVAHAGKPARGGSSLKIVQIDLRAPLAITR